MNSKQKTSNPSSLEQIDKEQEKLLKEINFLNMLERNWKSDDGKALILWILNESNPFAEARNKEGGVGYILGTQRIGRLFVARLTDAGVDLNIQDFAKGLNGNRINQLNDILTKLNKEKAKCQNKT